METTDIEMTPRHCDMIIKVCGMRNPENIRQVAALTPMLMGFIFWEGSKRSAIGLEQKVVAELPEYIRPVAVFVNPTVDQVIATSEKYGIKIVQLHGDETPQMCRELRRRGLTVFKAIGVDSRADLEQAAVYDGNVDLLILDCKSQHRGGTGQKFDWKILDRYPLATPYLLSGGIGPDDVGTIVGSLRKGMAGIDINSRFESAPGVKDLRLLTRFILTLRQYNEDEQIAKPFWEKTK
jgi:phosphoribosylanthranilate isomerase